MTLPDTPLDDVADELDDIKDRYDDLDMKPSTRNTPAEMLDAGVAIEFPLEVYGEEYTILSWVSSYRRTKLYAFVYHTDIELSELDEIVTDSTNITQYRMNVSKVADEDVQDDTAHALATVIAGLIRMLLDGRNYSGYTPDHDDPDIDEVEA